MKPPDKIKTAPAPDPEPEQPSARILEVEEFLFAHNFTFHSPHGERNLRDLLWTHRFFVVSWLLMNGATIPARLVDDRVHRLPGDQSVDKPA